MSDRRPEKFWSRWTMTLGLVAVSGAAAVTWTQAEENGVRPEVPDSNASEVWVASTEFKFVPATVRVIAGSWRCASPLDASSASPGKANRFMSTGGRLRRKPMRFPFLTSAYNSLSQRHLIELTDHACSALFRFVRSSLGGARQCWV